MLIYYLLFVAVTIIAIRLSSREGTRDCILLCGIVPRVLRITMSANAAKTGTSMVHKIKSWISSPTGPKTTHFWGPVANWGFVVAVCFVLFGAV